MPKRSGLILDSKQSSWETFLREFLEDTPSTITFTENSLDAGDLFGRTGPDFAFINHQLLSPALEQKLKVHKASSPSFRLFEINHSNSEKKPLIYDESFSDPPMLADFRRLLVEKMPLPDQINLLIIDDEPEIGNMVKEYLGDRIRPSFNVRYAGDGKKGLEMIEASKPDVLLLDIKMPVMDGFEVYRTIKRKNYSFSVIVFLTRLWGMKFQKLVK